MNTPTMLADDHDVITARRFEDSTYLRTWLRRWLVVLIAAAVTTIGFLVAIDIALANVDSSINRARDQAVGVSRNTGNLPFLLAQMTQHLEQIDSAQRPIPANELKIANTLAQTNQHLVVNVHNNVSIKNHQKVITASLRGIRSALVETEGHLAAILHLNQQVDSTLSATQSSASAGTTGLIRKTAAINAAQRAARNDSGNILSELKQANGHLTSICEAPQMQALGAFPPC